MLPTLWHLSLLPRKEGIKDQPDYSNKVIQGRTKMLLTYPPPGSNTPLNDTTMPSDDSSKTNLEVHVPSPLTLEIATLNLQIGDKGRRYPLCYHKELDRLGFSILSFNVVHPISNLSLIIVYLRLTLLFLFSCPLCLFLVIFRKPLKILSGSLLW